MKKLIVIIAVALPLAFSARAQWIVYDPTMNVQQIIDEAESLAKYVTMIDNQVQHAHQPVDRVQELRGRVRQSGQGAAVHGRSLERRLAEP